MQHREVQWISLTQLYKIGVKAYKLNGERDSEDLEKIKKEKGFKNSDEKEISNKLQNYDELVKLFSTEHFHADDEIRYVLKGSGYFDVRDANDKWIRIHVTKGDLLILPEGIYHRYVPDRSNYIYVMRLFQDEPKWAAINRPADDHESRKKYISKYFGK